MKVNLHKISEKTPLTSTSRNKFFQKLFGYPWKSAKVFYEISGSTKLL